MFATRSYDYGTLRFTINGQPAGADFDGFRAEPTQTGPIDLGTFTPRDGKLVLRAQVVGANPSSRGPRYYFGLDGIMLENAK